jgi:hypothetical protein
MHKITQIDPARLGEVTQFGVASREEDIVLVSQRSGPLLKGVGACVNER